MDSKIIFTDDLLVNMEWIDQDHRELYRITNELFSAVEMGKVAVSSVLGTLWSFTREHFAREEESMKQCNYDAFDVHKKDHGFLIFQLEELTGRLFISDYPVVDNDTTEFLTSWLRLHIRGFDRSLALYLSRNRTL